MNAIIAVVVSCLLNASPAHFAPENEVSNGQCSGSYIDKASGHVVGAWTMQVSLKSKNKAPAVVHVVKTGGRVVIASRNLSKPGIAELDIATLRAIDREVSILPAADGFASIGNTSLVF